MYKRSLTLLLFFLAATSFAQKPVVKINYNVELLGLAYFIGFEGVDIENKTVEVAGKKIPKKEWHAYGFYIYEKYKQYAASENLAKSFAVADHLWLDYILNLLIQVDDFPKASLPPDIPMKYIIGFSVKKDTAEARRKAAIFLEGLNKFYEEINFSRYITDAKPFYESVLNEVRANMPKADFTKTMEKFYKKDFDSYTLVPSLTIPKGMGFGLNYTKNGKTALFNVFGGFDMQDIVAQKMGFGNTQRLRELSIHEFGHSFVNPVVDSIPAELISSTAHLFDTVKVRMSEQGYNTWKACLYEHFVRAGEVVIAKKMGDIAGFERLYNEYVNDRKFIYLPVIVKELEKKANSSLSNHAKFIEIIKTLKRSYLQ